MASTIAIYTGDGTTTDFTVPFDYLAKKFVRVSLGSRVLQGGDYGDTSKDYYFLDKTTVRLKVPPQAGEVLTIRRYTSATDRVVSFKDASVLKATDLDVSSVQTIHIAEEGRDIINDALIKDKKGNWDAKGNRITNVGTPVDDSDAMTYGIYKADALGALQSKLDAEKARDRAVEAETNSKKSEENAKLSEVNAQASANTAVSASEHADAVMVENQAIIQEAREIIADNRVLHKETKDNTAITVAKANEAVLSAKNAKDSELNAKRSEEAVTSVATSIEPIIPVTNELKILANNIDHVITDSSNIGNINIVGTDLTGSLSDTSYDDYGDLGNTGAPLPAITGGNIKIVADNIESVRTVAGLAPDFEIAIESVNTINSLTIRAENASKSAEASATTASNAEASARASEVSASGSAGLANDWANKIDGTVDGTEYSAKYYAIKAKTEGGQAVEQAVASAVQQVTNEGTKQVNLAKAEVTKATEQVNIATTQAGIATTKANEASADADSAHSSAVQADTSAKNSANSASSSASSATASANSAKAAKTSEDNAASYKIASSNYANNAKSSENEAKRQADLAKGYANQAASGQVNADWNETVSTSKAFIKNKPTLGALASKDSIAYSEITGTPTQPDLTLYAKTADVNTALSGKANTSHTHAVGDVNGLQTVLNTINDKISKTGNRGAIAGYSTSTSGAVVNASAKDSQYTASAVTVKNGSSGQTWTKVVKMSAGTVTLESNWTWVGGETPELKYPCLLVCHWNQDKGITGIVAGVA